MTLPLTKKFRIAEIFGPTIQGEGRNVGIPCHFVRFGGCDYRCTWCDTPYAVLPEEVNKLEQLTAWEIFYRTVNLSGRDLVPKWVVLTGGNPVLFHLEELVKMFHNADIQVMVETQGSIWKEWLYDVDDLCISPKPPSSQMDPDFRTLQRIIEKFNNRENKPYLKIPVFEQADYEFARHIHWAYPELEMFISVGNQDPLLPTVGNPNPDDTGPYPQTETIILDSFRDLTERMVMDSAMRDVRIFPQQHVLAWGNVRGH